MTLIAYSTVRHEDLRDVVSKIVQEQNEQFLNLFLKQDIAATDTKHYWTNKKLKGLRDTLSTVLTDTTTTAIVITDVANKRIITNTTYIKIDDEILGPVTSATSSTNTLQAARGALGTTAATHSAGADVHFLEMGEEGADNSRDDSQQGSKVYNVCQIFRAELKMSGTSQAVKSVGNDNAWSNQVQELLPELMQKLRIAAVSGARYADADESLRMMGGLSWWVSNADDEGGNSVSVSMINKKFIELLDNGVQPGNLVILASPQQAARIYDFKLSRIVGGGMADTSTVIRQNVDSFEFGEATAPIYRVPEIPRNEFYIVDKSKIRICPMQNRSFRVEDIGKVGDSVQKLLIGEYTMEVMNATDAHIRVKNLAY